MNLAGMISYGTAGLGFMLLTVLLATSWNGRRTGAWLIAASAMTAVWAAVLTVEHHSGAIPVLLLYAVEILRDAAWIYALTCVGGAALPRSLSLAARVSCGVLLVLLLSAPLLAQAGVRLNPTLLLSRAGLILSLAALILLEQIYRNAGEAARGSLRYFCIGVGGLFAYDLFMYSQGELLGNIAVDSWNARGLINAFAVPLIAIAARRNPHWSLEVFVSRQVVFYTTTFMAVGVYLVLMSIGGYYVQMVGGSWGRVAQIIFLAGAAVVLASLLGSPMLRRRAQVFISKHFYRNKYDYRLEWLRFIKTLSSQDEADVPRTALRAIAQIFGSPGGLLFLREEEGRSFVPHAAWPMRLDSMAQLAAIDSSEALPRFLARTEWIIDTRELREQPVLYENLILPAWLRNHPQMRIVSPLLQLDQLVGFVVLYEPPPPFQLTYEDRDLLKTVGRHVATHIAQHEADRKLAEARQFEAYNRLTAFMMHDLKNSIAQLQLIIDNAQRHRHKPEFIDDALGTIDNTVARMTRLMEQLRGTAASERSLRVDLAELTLEAVRRCASRRPAPAVRSAGEVFVQADRERLTNVIEHILRNAQDATGEDGRVEVSLDSSNSQATLIVQDTGAGMDATFLRQRLFRPFDSTKGAKGMGIGAYQAREYVRSIGGKVEVCSSPGQGTRFAVTLPLWAETAHLDTVHDEPAGPADAHEAATT
ncbi:hypothetical protein ACG33_10215 [Steroidobacter denitrificans]|uniref:histidine kinase n=2 Tax=Steroidobacter denitrificans TaxID=465721 RepID=A0A127FD11_STEDE|nr:hypothetical protein ACG33_10215 [Steroidobacter denitrificans]